MNTNDNDKNGYNELIDKIGEHKFRERYMALRDSAEKFIKSSGFSEVAQCNERILFQTILDYYADIFRLEEFHKIKEPRTEKIFAYTIAWIVKRKPIQYIKNFDNEKDIYVNERFAAYLLLNECLGSYKINQKYQEQLDNYISLVIYYFKYRECNPRVIELAIESFKMGMRVIKNEDEK